MFMRLRIFLVMLSCTLLQQTLHAQYNDAGLWVSAGAEKKITRKLTASLSSELRFNENWAELGKWNTDLGGEYKLLKEVKVGLFCRFIADRRLDNSYNFKHRYFGDLSIKHKFGKITATYRFRYQAQFRDYNEGDDWTSASKYMRNKVTLKYDMKHRLTPTVYGELWTDLQEHMIDNYRIYGGMAYEINKRHSVEGGYLINRQVNIENPITSYVVALNYQFSF